MVNISESEFSITIKRVQLNFSQLHNKKHNSTAIIPSTFRQERLNNEKVDMKHAFSKFYSARSPFFSTVKAHRKQDSLRTDFQTNLFGRNLLKK